MATPSELSLEEMLKYLLDNGGLVRNQDLVRHFKRFLVQPDTRVIARNKFKEYINTLATIKTREGEKYLELKRKFRQTSLDLSSPTLNFPTYQTSSPEYSSPGPPLREPPPYRLPPSPFSSPINSPVNSNLQPARRCVQEPYNTTVCSVSESISEENESVDSFKIHGSEDESNSSISSPPIPPRRKSQEKAKYSSRDSLILEKAKLGSELNKENENCPMNQLTPAEQLSVRERMQRFNRMATETDLPSRPHTSSTLSNKKRSEKGNEEDDRASVASQLDGKSREWLVKAAQGDYHALAKLAAEEPRLCRTKDPASGYTALHWGAKHGDENIVKLIAGTYKNYIKSVNDTSNGGYTALHIALQFDHENIFNLLVQVYGANQDIRDYSGKKPRQYSISQKAAVSQDTMRKIKARKKHAEKDLGFLRIGSLNVRVKRTTEAFSQFLGVTTNASNNEKIHKSWGSADNLPQDQKLMPPPKYAPIKKRRSKRAQDFLSPKPSHSTTSLTRSKTVDHRSSASSGSPRRTVSTLIPTKSIHKEHQQNDSDSDTACGFDSSWRGSSQL